MSTSEPLSNRTIVLIGCGNMGSAIVDGLVDDGTVPPDRIVCADHNASKNEALAERHGVKPLSEGVVPADGTSVADRRLFVVAVKPSDVGNVLESNAPFFRRGDVVVSIAAGVSTDALQSEIEAGLGEGADPPAVVRAMPNAPAEVGAGITGVYGSDTRAVDAAEALFDAVGETVRLENESDFDPLTALSGSGPAFVFALLEAMADGAVAEGLSRDKAVRLARETVRGAAELARRSDEHTAELKDRVTSPGGTTAAGLAALEEQGARSALLEAVRHAAAKSRELGDD